LAFRARPVYAYLVADDNGNGLGFGFFLKIAGLVIAGGLIAMIIFLILSHFVYAFGFLGGFLIFAGLLLGIGWLWDRSHRESSWEE
jgi:hypothetical protein